MIQKIKVGAVSYLNTKPLIYGFEQGMMKEKIELVIDYPANIASLLEQNKIDVGLVPVAVIPSLQKYYLVSDYCIGCDGKVASVCLFSDVALHEIETILLDYQSRTSAVLLKILLKEYWHISPSLIIGKPGYEKDIRGTTAGLIIGDRAFQQRQKSTYIFDLGEAWKKLTGLSFIFAAWIGNKELPPDFVKVFNNANQTGLDNLSKIVAQNPCNDYDLDKYYRENIKFHFPDKHEVIALFLEKLNQYT